jgi:hypothetical protein
MKEFFKRFPLSRRTLSRPVLVLIVFLGVYLFHNYYYSNKHFHIPSKKKQTLQVVEKGNIKYVSGGSLEIMNNYKTEENLSRIDSFITIQGKIDGRIDPVLAPLFNTKKYLTEIDVSDIEGACSPDFNPLYPVAIRRLIYFMPEGAIFDGQIWEINTCRAKFRCSYTLLLKNKKASVEMLCSGNIHNSEVAMSGNLAVNEKLNGFDSVTLEITSSSPELVSNWVFQDTLK